MFLYSYTITHTIIGHLSSPKKKKMTFARFPLTTTLIFFFFFLMTALYEKYTL